MLKINRDNKSFLSLDTPSLIEASITERHDLQEFICNSSTPFFKELGFDLFLIAKEVEPSDDVQDRIDLLALDKEGNAVVIELKRGNNKLQMYQAISYAGMLANWEPRDFLDFLSVDQREQLQDQFLEVEIEEINRNQRLILIAEQFDYSVLVGAEWLNEKHNVDIICCRISLAKDAATGSEFLVCSNIYPVPELTQQAIRRGSKGNGLVKPRWSSWDTALADITNPAVVNYFKTELRSRNGQDSYLPKRILGYRIDGKRRLNLTARRQNAYGWQIGRFDGDIDFWRSALSQPEYVKDVKRGQCLSMSLSTPEDFTFFHDSVTKGLLSKNWTELPEPAQLEIENQE